MKKITALVVAMAFGIVALVAGPASAHTPGASANCNGVLATAENYSDNAHITVTVAGKVVEDRDFSREFNYTYNVVPQDGTVVSWEVNFDERSDGDQYDKTFTGTVGPCGKTPPPPVCDDECEIPLVHTNAPEVTKCTGVIVDKVLNNVRVAAGRSCTLVGSHVNGSITTAKGARNLTLADVTVRKNVNATGLTGDFSFGAKGGFCRYDPFVGGNLNVIDSHNVLICQASVCKDIVVRGNDGRITVRDSKARRVVVQNNRKFVSDTAKVYHGQRIIRLNNVKGQKVISGNQPRKVKVY